MLGSGKPGCLCLIIKTADYIIAENELFNGYENPGPTPTIPENSAQRQTIT